MNERLKNAMSVGGIDIETIVQAINVDPKTVQRWIHGRVPHTRHRWKLAKLLGEREEFLWPIHSSTVGGIYTSEVVAAYAYRSDVPPTAWFKLFFDATERIDLLGYAMLFLPEQNSGLIELFKKKASMGCKIRIAIANPRSNVVQMRDDEEKLGGTLSSRILTTMHHFLDLYHCDNIEIRYHTTIMYNSIFRGDGEMFVTPHLYGLHGSKSPLFHLRSLGMQGVFSNFASHFETIWSIAQTTREEE
jgi:hypothetical protein